MLPWVIDHSLTFCRCILNVFKLGADHVKKSPNASTWELVKALLTVYPESATKASHLGLLPLHYVVLLTDEVYHMLMDMYPAGAAAADHELNLPLHYAVFCYAPLERVDGLIAAYKEGVSQKNAAKKSPIDLAFEKRKDGKGFRVLNILLDATWENAGGSVSIPVP